MEGTSLRCCACGVRNRRVGAWEVGPSSFFFALPLQGGSQRASGASPRVRATTPSHTRDQPPARANAATGEFLARRALKAEHKAEALRPRPYAQEHLISLNGASLQPTLDVCQGAVVRGIAFSPDGGAMATGDAACEARVWGTGDGSTSLSGRE